MDIEGMLKRSFNVCGDNLTVFLPRAIELGLEIVSFVAFVIVFILFLGLSLSPFALASISNPDVLLSGLESKAFLIVALLIFGIVALAFLSTLLRAFARAAVIGMADEGFRSGSTSLGSGWEAAKRHGFDVFWAFVLIGVITLLLVSAGLVPFVLGALFEIEATVLFAFGFFGVFLGIIVSLLFYLLTLFVPQEIVLKGKGAVGGIRGSASFVRNNIFDVLIYIAVVAGISIVMGMVGFGAFLPMSIIAENVPFLRVALEISQNMISVLVGLLLAPYYETVKTAMVREGSASASAA